MKTHRLKIESTYFDKVIDGSKRFEIRFNDRDYEVGDILILNEVEKSALGNWGYTGRDYSVKVTYLTDFPAGLRENYVAMSILPLDDN